MGLCFICDEKLFGERTRVCSSITPEGNVPYPEKIAELLGEEFVIIVTPADHMCKRCSTLLKHFDKLENNMKLIRDTMISFIQKKYRFLPSDRPVKTLDVVSVHLISDDLEVGQSKVSSCSTVGESPSVHTPLKMMKPTSSESSNSGPSSTKIKIYKCGFCTYQSKELAHVRFHMRTHMKKNANAGGVTAAVGAVSGSGDGEKTQSVAKVLTPVPQPQKTRLYRCQVCSLSYESRKNCLDHIQKDHKPPANEDKESNEGPKNPKKAKLELPKSQDNQQAADSTTETDGQHTKGTVDTDMLLNDHVPAEEVAASEKQEESNDVDETASQEKELPVQDEVLKSNEALSTHEEGISAQDEQESAVQNQTEQGEGMEVDQATDNVGKEDKEMANGDGTDDNKTGGDLDIESMLAAIHNDNPATAEDTQNMV